jgi:hypothetical protein
VLFNAIQADIDTTTGRALNIMRVSSVVKERA